MSISKMNAPDGWGSAHQEVISFGHSVGFCSFPDLRPSSRRSRCSSTVPAPLMMGAVDEDIVDCRRSQQTSLSCLEVWTASMGIINDGMKRRMFNRIAVYQCRIRVYTASSTRAHSEILGRCHAQMHRLLRTPIDSRSGCGRWGGRPSSGTYGRTSPFDTLHCSA